MTSRKKHEKQTNYNHLAEKISRFDLRRFQAEFDWQGLSVARHDNLPSVKYVQISNNISVYNSVFINE